MRLWDLLGLCIVGLGLWVVIGCIVATVARLVGTILHTL